MSRCVNKVQAKQSGIATFAMSSFLLMILRSIDPRRRQKSDRVESAPKWRPTDTVLPVHAIDNTATLKAIVTSQALRFNDVLDGDLLHSSLTELLSTGNWKRLGGRFRVNVRVPSRKCGSCYLSMWAMDV